MKWTRLYGVILETSFLLLLFCCCSLLADDADHADDPDDHEKESWLVVSVWPTPSMERCQWPNLIFEPTIQTTHYLFRKIEVTSFHFTHWLFFSPLFTKGPKKTHRCQHALFVAARFADLLLGLWPGSDVFRPLRILWSLVMLEKNESSCLSKQDVIS